MNFLEVKERAGNFIQENPEVIAMALGAALFVGVGRLKGNLDRKFQPDMVEIARENFGFNKHLIGNHYAVTVLGERHPLAATLYWAAYGVAEALKFHRDVKRT